MIPRLVVASKNPDKIAEMEQIISEIGLTSEIVRDLDWEDVEETGSTLVENALLKARAVVEATGLPAVADDTGLEVASLGGAPGVHTARYAGEDATYRDNVAKLLSELEGAEDRSASFVSVVVLAFPDGVEVVAEGRLEGQIGHESRGDGGFGYDPVFVIDGKSLSEMGEKAKNSLSHRARALRNLGEMVGL